MGETAEWRIQSSMRTFARLSFGNDDDLRLLAPLMAVHLRDADAAPDCMREAVAPADAIRAEGVENELFDVIGDVASDVGSVEVGRERLGVDPGAGGCEAGGEGGHMGAGRAGRMGGRHGLQVAFRVGERGCEGRENRTWAASHAEAWADVRDRTECPVSPRSVRRSSVRSARNVHPRPHPPSASL